VSDWVIGVCTDGTRVDTRTVVTQPIGNGDSCPVLSRTRTCTDNVYDLALTKADPSGTYSPGDDVTYTITIINQGDIDADNIQVTDYIPSGLSFVSSTANVVSSGANTVVLDFDLVAVS